MSHSSKAVGAMLSVAVILGILPLSADAEDFFTTERAHQYLGYGTIALAGATAATGSEVDIHEPLAYATAAFALSTLLTGYLAHDNSFDTSNGLFTRDNIHIMLATAGAVILTAGVIMAAESYDGSDKGSVSSGHAGLGAAGGIMMTVAIIDLKW